MPNPLQPNPGYPLAVVPVGGMAVQAVVITDANGDAPATNEASYLYRDSLATFQTAAAVTAPAANGIICSITPGVAGLYEINGMLSITGTTTAADANNFKLNQSASGVLNPIPYNVPATAGGVNVPAPTVVLNLLAADSVSFRAVAAGNAAAIYAASIVARRVG